MSSYLKSGERQAKVAKMKEVRKHTKAFYRILREMEVVYKKLDPTIKYNEENINEYVLPVYGRELDSMEKMIVLGKLHHGKEENRISED